MSDLDTTTPADELIRLLTGQQDLVDRLDTLAGHQHTLIESGDCEALLDLLAQRQEVMDRFLAGQDGLDRLARSARDAGDDARKRIGGLIAAITGGLDRIVSRDEEDRARLEISRDRASDERDVVRTARQARRAYVRAGAGDPRFADRQG